MADARSPGLPTDVVLLLEFVNTLDVEKLVDAVPTPAALDAWCRARGLVAASDTFSPDAFRAAIDAREALRAVLLSHTGEPLAASDLKTLERVAASSPLTVGFGQDGVSLRPAATGGWKALGALFAAIVSTQRDGHWPRMKVCAAGACQEAFYDTSKNRSGRWCSMAVCGNRTKLQRFRASPPRR
ncbi:CGNR zinc finger domain-containing protein [Myxococcus sp. MISCRS1]|jgi:predicted RNA-binding Zn ribbon-like protein|uniref:CGNR zinc finger domain-containing protein n=1 Tax=Myxococcus TaxID=32 RepID=UPI001CBCC505|nr:MULTISPECIES: CGNR zinc finger domain-containing protein [unclassified Myxococcus]MBZ4413654.1 CGNR zinc finger domain-containing protein [Myxococcus sp. XM-1-1-1]MCY0996872.1 CGNR zinc finger domain-containing protein [Myxococcus sp. MISCRS1]